MEQFVKRNAIEVVGISYPVNTDTFQHNMRRNTSEKKKKKQEKRKIPNIAEVLEMDKIYYFVTVEFRENFI